MPNYKLRKRLVNVSVDVLGVIWALAALVAVATLLAMMDVNRIPQGGLGEMLPVLYVSVPIVIVALLLQGRAFHFQTHVNYPTSAQARACHQDRYPEAEMRKLIWSSSH